MFSRRSTEAINGSFNEAQILKDFDGAVKLLCGDPNFFPPIFSSFSQPRMTMPSDPQTRFPIFAWQVPVDNLAQKDAGDQIASQVNIDALDIYSVPTNSFPLTEFLLIHSLTFLK